jgi:hypothetical protein
VDYRSYFISSAPCSCGHADDHTSVGAWHSVRSNHLSSVILLARRFLMGMARCATVHLQRYPCILPVPTRASDNDSGRF